MKRFGEVLAASYIPNHAIVDCTASEDPATNYLGWMQQVRGFAERRHRGEGAHRGGTGGKGAGGGVSGAQHSLSAGKRKGGSTVLVT